MPSQPSIPQVKQIAVASPLKGINTVMAREGQPPETCWDALNILPYDRFGRARVGQRPGLIEIWPGQPIGAPINWVQGLLPVNFVVYPINSIADSTFGGTTPTEFIIRFSTHPVGSPQSTTSTVMSPAMAGPNGFTISFNYSTISQAIFPVTGSTSFSTVLDVYVGGTLVSQMGYSLSTFGTTASFVGMGTHGVATGQATGPQTLQINGTGFGGGCQVIVGPTAASTIINTVLISTTPITLSTLVPNVNFTYNISYVGTTSTYIPSTLTALDTFQVTAPAQYFTEIVATAGGVVWLGTPNMITVSGGINSILNPNVQTAAAYLNGLAFIVDGTTIAELVLSTNTLVTYAASTGTAPTNCNLACNWRGRLVLAGDSQNPQNFYMARTGNPFDWNYAATDPAAAVAGNLSNSGQIGEPITCLIPYTDDYMIIGCARSIWMLEGDPADGGTIVRVSDKMGILGKDAWTVDGAGLLYFVATGGLYSVKPMWEFYKPPELMSGGNFNQFFQNLDYGQNFISLAWDTDLHYLYIFVTPISSTGAAGFHLVYDGRNGGLWPVQYPVTAGPTATCLYAGSGTSTSRAVIMGGWDGLIRAPNYFAFTDDGSTIVSNIVLGPFHPFPEASNLVGTTIDFGENIPGDSISTWNVNVELASGVDAYQVTEGTPHSLAVINCPLDRRQKTFRQRLRGGWFSLTLQNGNPSTQFSFESAVMEFDNAGRNRGVR